jgi:phospholipase/lecithinase/hemolysin
MKTFILWFVSLVLGFKAYAYTYSPHEYYLSCTYVDKGENPSRFYYFGNTSLWAKTHEEIYLMSQGYLQDGFWHSQEVFEQHSDKKVPLHPHSLGFLKKFCFERLKEEYPGKDTEIINVKAVSPKNQERYPIVMPSHGSEKMEHIIIFGDGLSDDGSQIKLEAKAIKKLPAWEGRYTNGLMWSDYLAQPLDTTAIKNYARSGVKVLPEHLDVQESITLEDQVNEYLKTIKTKHLEKGPETLFIFWFGLEEYMDLRNGDIISSPFLRTIRSSNEKQEAVKNVVKEIGHEIKKLYHKGGRNFLVLNSPHPRFLPIYQSQNLRFEESKNLEENEKLRLKNEQNQFLVTLVSLVETHNTLLQQELALLRTELKDAKIIEVDTTLIYEKMYMGRHPVKLEPFDYGFVENKAETYALRGSLYRKRFNLLKDKHMFWNGVQLTSFGQCWLSFYILNTMSHQTLILREIKLEDYKQQYCKF